MLEVIYDTWTQGGFVLIPIVLVGFWGLSLIFFTYLDMGQGAWKSNLRPIFKEVRDLLARGEVEGAKRAAETAPQLVGYGLSLTLDNRGLAEPALRRLLEEKLSFELYGLQRRLPLVGVMAVSAPLLGLLGTVSGLVHTFRVMTEYGNSNAVLLAHGISEALIATQSGLLLAIVLILLGQRLDGKVRWLQSQVESGVTMLLNQLHPGAEGET